MNMQKTLARGPQRCSALPSRSPAHHCGVQARRRVTTTALAQFFGGRKASKASKAPPVRETVVPGPSFGVPAGFAAVAALTAYEGVTPLAWITGVLAVFLTVQATRVRFVFDDQALEVLVGGKEGEQTENAFVGGRNRWTYDSFINWEFWWPSFPVLVYFKETQTKPEGQIHFFPILFDGKKLYDVMVERCGPSLNSGPR